ncbi:TPA: hypothetical protein CPT92_08825 [Candidatus Gastranaerophilales bacterium HUM_13]|jgi:hypothetical protein|nr:unknown [Acinetobacter sp. CAG:196]DAB05647.1 MAG TPA: hypothetical protein CPT92_08825 [Candidatus Gastranaerophilales bacterium HUM_13]DAB10741.1 MAG TPA: hypothetical protein CPT95_01920 [Candidatus Gastranaerophilales bacterium HUM_15]DAB14622.1 MAG TPA: hypothetical protein CPU00_08770 [Candidatus Gastranaerophilales bacterium HUM_18]
MKLEFNMQRIARNPVASFDIFSQKVTKSIKKKEKVDASTFSCELMGIGDVFEKQGKKPVMNKMAQRLAETLVNMGDSNLSGIIYSFLIKFNKDNAKIAEQIALNALAIANRQKDSIHIMARSYDLKEIYKQTEYGSEKHLKALYGEKRALKDIVTNYDNVIKKYRTVTREAKPKETYELMLCDNIFEIIEILKKKEPKRALEELNQLQEAVSRIKQQGTKEKNLRRIKELSEKIKP